MYIVSNLKRRKSRTALTTTGIVLAVALSVIMFSVGEGIRNSTRTILEESGVDIFVRAKGANPMFGTLEIEHGREIAKRIAESDDRIRSSFPILDEKIYAMNSSSIRIAKSNPTDFENISIVSVSAIGEVPSMRGDIGGMNLLEGSDFTVIEDEFYANGTYSGNLSHEVIINKVTAKSLKLSLGDKLYLTGVPPDPKGNISQYASNLTEFRVVGIVEASWEDLGSKNVYLKLSELQYMVGKVNDTIDEVLIDLYNPQHAKAVKKKIESEFNLSAYTQEDYLKEVEKFTKTFEGFADIIAITTTIIALMFTSTVMMMSVGERKSEIGMLRAIGIPRGKIVLMILGEACILVLIGFVIGILIGYSGSVAVDNYLRGTFESLPSGFHYTQVTATTLFEASTFAALMGLISGAIPSWVAANLNIVEMLRGE